MIDALDSLKYKKSDITDIGVGGDNFTLPTYQQKTVNGTYVYDNTYIPKYLETSQNYTVKGHTDNQKLIQDYVEIQSSYNPIEWSVDYLGNTIYDSLENADISYFLYWYDKANNNSVYTIQRELTSKPLYNNFSSSVGNVMLYSPNTDTIKYTSIQNTNIIPYNRSFDDIISDDIKHVLTQSYKDANSSYVENIINVGSTSDPSSSHGTKLVVDVNNNTRYSSASSGYISNLKSRYKQLLYITPLYAIKNIPTNFLTEPYFNTTIEGNSIVVDRLGSKVSTDQGWNETIMLSAYPEE